MDGERIQNYWSDEVDALVRTYRQFEKLIPSERVDGAAHAGEDGRYVEDLVREYLQQFLPRDLEVLTGFILRPAVKTGETGRERKNDQDQHSGQLDVIVYDSAAYPVFQRFGNSVIVPPEGVIAVVSIKKHLNDSDVLHECSELFDAASLCQTLRSNNRDDTRKGVRSLFSRQHHRDARRLRGPWRIDSALQRLLQHLPLEEQLGKGVRSLFNRRAGKRGQIPFQ